MTRYERRVYFERLIELRTAYAAAGADDRTTVISIEDAIADAARVFAELQAQDEAALRGTASEPSTAADPDEPGKVR